MRKGIKKAVSACLGLLLIVSPIAGCGTNTGNTTQNSTTSQSSTSQSSTSTQPQQVTISAMIQSSWWVPGMDALSKAATEKTGISLDVQKVPEGVQGEQVIKTKIASGEPSDILFYQSGGFFKMLNPEANFVDLTNDPVASMISNDTLKSAYTQNAKLYGIPYSGMGITFAGIFYNKKVFSDLNLQIPKTWQDFLNACEKIKDAGKVPVYTSAKDAWTTQMFYFINWPNVVKKNPGIVDKINTNKIKFSEIPEYVENMNMYNTLNQKGYLNKDYLSATYDNGQKALTNGDAAMYPMYSFVMDQIGTNYPDKVNDIGAFAMPYDGDNIVSVLAAGGVYIPKAAKNIDAAKKWLQYYASGEGQSAYYTVGKGVPMYKDVKAGQLYPAFDDLAKYMDAGKSMTDIKSSLPVDIPDTEVTCQSTLAGKSALDASKTMDENFAKAMKTTKQPGW